MEHNRRANIKKSLADKRNWDQIFLMQLLFNYGNIQIVLYLCSNIFLYE